MINGAKKLDWQLNPLDAVVRWPTDRPLLMLHSGRHDAKWARWSVFASPTDWFEFTGDSAGRDPLGQLRQAVAKKEDGLWLGYLSYDIGRWIERLPRRAADDRSWPIIQFGFCPGYLVHDGADGSWYACGSWRGIDFLDLAVCKPVNGDFSAGELTSVFDRHEYESAVARVIEYIRAGDVFQVNLAQRFTAQLHGSFPGTHRAMYTRLAQVSPAWYGAYMELPGAADSTRVIASTSPELFLQVSPEGKVITRPIKGTRPGHVDPGMLADSEKDKAELAMIVDLMRNDLGRVCRYGSVRVTEPRVIESHPTVHHGVSTIEGQLHPSRDMFDLFKATLPGGSVTGAPKVRTMQIIDELEPVRRGPYCGSIGYISRDSGACLNIAIRTMLATVNQSADTSRVDFSVGGGIVADSEPAAEYEETIDKAAAILKTLELSVEQPN